MLKLLKALAFMWKPDAGKVMVNGYELGKEDHAIRQSIGVVFQDSLLDKLLTVEENMRCRGAMYGLKGKALTQAVKQAMASVGVEELPNDPMASYLVDFKHMLGVTFEFGSQDMNMLGNILVLIGSAALFFLLAVMNISRKKKV